MKALKQLQGVAVVAVFMWMLALSALLPLRNSKKLDCDSRCNCYKTWIKFRHRHEQIVMRCTHLNLTEDLLPLPPTLSSNMSTRLYLENGTIPYLSNTSLSVYSPYRIVILSLKNNTIEYVAKDAFGNLTFLKTLDLSLNIIPEGILKEAFYGIALTPLTTLNISSMNLQNISDGFFKHLESIDNFKLIFLDNTYMFPMTALMRLNHMISLDFGGNNLSLIHLHDASFTSLRYLNLDNNHLYDFPDFCFKESNSSRFPTLQILKIQWNVMKYIQRDNYNCLISLTHLYLNGNLFQELRSNQFSMLPNIFKITLSYVGCAMHNIQRAVFNNSKLKQIYFRENHIWFTEPKINLRVFEGCSSLELLNLNDNVFKITSEYEFNAYLGDLTSLRILVMGGNGLRSIPRVITEKLTNIESLALYDNSISDLSPLKNMTNLKKLFMGINKITTLDESSFQLLRRNLTDINLSRNPFSCECKIYWFIEWMRKQPRIFGFKKDPKLTLLYNCASPGDLDGHSLLDLEMSEITCLLGMDVKITTLTLSILLIVFLVTGAVMYRYRWHIRYFIYMVRYSQRQEVDTREYEYDVFVAYSAPDRPWVIKTLLPVLEVKENLKLCVHDRDFEVGKLIVDNIVDAIETSRKIVIVLSNEFAQSGWCQFELNLIQRHVLENGQRLLVVVMLEEIDTRHVTKAMRAMLQTTTYLMWAEEEYARKAFFNRLRMLLRRVTRRGWGRRLSI
ncbi:toll-like receptor 3 [Haliotis rufescens]|uniref:toll-like receptor 3 n=1 Tax=Haliotis rufescens TaxID=6454 RepID=UPI00201F1064|nr:toll-like receptor 3 [Haliotis rufescens]